MKEKIKSVPDLALNSHKHITANIEGLVHFRSWQYNVADRFKDKTTQEIKQTLRDTSNPFAILFENWLGDFNIATGIRNANAFNAREVFYIGNRKIDKRGTVGTHNYIDVQWLSSIDELLKLKEKYTIVGIDNIAGSVSISQYKFVPNTLFVFGEEGTGLTPTMQSLCKDIIEIDIFGSVRSLNCGVASGIICYDFVRQIKSFL